MIPPLHFSIHETGIWYILEQQYELTHSLLSMHLYPSEKK